MALRQAGTANADQFAKGLAPVMENISAQGHKSLRAVAAELNRLGMMTRRGGMWEVSNVRNLLARIKQVVRPRTR